MDTIKYTPTLREKLLTAGPSSLSDTELLAILISSGSRKKSCLHLAIELIKKMGDLRAILNCSYQDFSQVNGVGLVRYAQLQAVKEICRRSDLISLQKDIKINNSQQSFAFLKRQLRDLRHETFAAIFLDNQHRVLAFEQIFKGTINAATVFIRPIIDRVLNLNAAAVILAHNHPSGVCDPSKQDVLVTKKIQQALDLMEVRLLDHVIIGDNEVYSILNSQKWACV